MTLHKISSRAIGPDTAPDRSRIEWYREPGSGRTFFVLSQTGAFADLCHDHGLLLGTRIDEGVFPEILDTVAVDTDVATPFLDQLFSALFVQITEDLFRATSDEFQRGVHQLHKGFRQATGGARGFAEVMTACMAIDAGNVATGFTQRLRRWGAADAPLAEAIDYVLAAMAAYGRRPGPGVSRASVADAVAAQGGRRLLGMGCTGFALAPRLTGDGLGLLGRTFDGAFFRWNAVPGLFVIDERGTDPRIRHRYAAVGTAGLIYPAGISGINDAGLASSLHQMSTTTYSTGRPGGGWEIAPFVQQRIMREAGSLDEAVAVVRGCRHFASWAILVSDARAGRAVRIEINGRADRDGGQRVEVSFAEPRQIQTNHFREGPLAEAFDHFGDAHFTKSTGKWLESRSRLATATDRLDVIEGAVGVDEALRLLADHDDHYLSDRFFPPPLHPAAGSRRPFGRTICKAYGQVASIVRADPDRARARDQIWVTIGHDDGRPGPHSPCVGFDIDWKAMALRPAADPVREAHSLNARALEGCAAYVEAFRTLARPVAAGRYLGRDPDPAELAALRAQALAALDRAVALDEAPGTDVSVAYRYVRARLRHVAGRHGDALRDWDDLLRFAARRISPVRMNDYERGLICLYAGATEAALGNRGRARNLAAMAREWFRIVGVSLFGDGPDHPDLDRLKSLADRLRTHAINGPDDVPALPPIDFVTVE